MYKTLADIGYLAIYDRELSLSERSVKIYDITHNSSHIQGKYTVHILPEGFVLIWVSCLSCNHS